VVPLLELARPGLTMLPPKLVDQFMIPMQSVGLLMLSAPQGTATVGPKPIPRVSAPQIPTASEPDLSATLPAFFPERTIPMPSHQPVTARSAYAHHLSGVPPILHLPGIRIKILVVACLHLKLNAKRLVLLAFQDISMDGMPPKQDVDA